jgi:transposase InsO family protein
MARVFKVTPAGYRKWKKSLNRPNKHATLLADIKKVLEEDRFNESYGVHRMYEKLKLSYGYEGSERKIYRIMKENNLLKHSPKGITKSNPADKAEEDLLKMNFKSEKPLEKLVTDITEIKVLDGKLYMSGIFDCYCNELLGMSIASNMKKELVIDSLRNASLNHDLRGSILHSDRGSQYTAIKTKEIISNYGIIQSMNSGANRCHDNAKCESMWGRFKEELVYNYNCKKMKKADVINLLYRYWIYWNERRICSAIGGIPPALKRDKYYMLLQEEKKAA